MKRSVARFALAAAVVLAPLPAAGGTVVPDCSMLAATPPGSPLVVWCASAVQSQTTGRTERVRLWRSSGDGRWVEAKAANVVASAAPAPPQVSPGWAQDHTLYWATSAGLHASTDLGETFTLVAPLVTGNAHPARRVLLTGMDSGVRAAVAGYDPHDIGYATTSGVTVVAPGSPDDDIGYVAAPDGIGVLGWDTATTAPHRITAYRCTELFVCTIPWFTLPAPTDGWAQQFVGAWRRTGAAAEEPSFLVSRAGPNFGTVSVFGVTSSAAGLPAANAAVAAVGDGRNAPSVAFAFDGTRVLMRVLSWTDRRATAHDRVYVSADRGASWRPVVTASTDSSGRVNGTGGWRPGAVSMSFVPALHARGNVWIANVSDGVRYVFRCSRDAGKHWRSSCM